MILFNDVVQVLARSALAFLGQQVVSLEIANSADVRRVFVNIDHARGGEVRSSQDFAKKSLSRSSATGLVQQEIEDLAGGIDGSVEIHPLSADFDIGFIDLPRIVGLLQVRPTSFINFWRIFLNPAVDGGVIQGQTSLRHHFR